ncbi:vesicle-trafficking protein SEC22c isoform X1 [Phascolarctos cinereus]|uniref:Vesicle-trafficking protein SEC22c n=1 Tax=Phascolarctos cinereus TaxID=38626 RepID=A0A6P5LDH2_PHACI|nr:vesicle-trafficking protein SEC22c [Phascolarctos cinereus]XP_020854764.1 vesicle-trafficking protein SEC22c [Phascolarctos cinereus]XP_020854765.1 vesicle-trafficking protein SEC22c [Phascolarctos cinereus]XP_020854766.1 vesicle-trafficking protein SEC22c [Phascolarctos cinereus]XP_020854767.1 vesicle-trafficking protein SEC22c [Phascolarctos cinereus]XP_020854768.1 vesicle-trafficking protein SEC22c [Phascolarctos cinereus]XP_020854769.1 vesicle-trafficking protein SEC22c [Phascolarctos 
MSMILFACVVRVRDGLPLSASTDFHHNQDFLECRKQLKTLSLILTQFPGRGTAEGHDLNIHFDSSGAIACMGICSRSYPVAMAFCFLEALRWEFTASYDNTSIGLASRPYAFLKFDSVIQKVKWHFNYASSSQLKNHLEKIQEELLLQPPLVLRLEDTEVMNGLRSNHSPMQAEYAPNYRMKPVTALGILSLILNIMCAALNLIRGIHLAEHSFQDDPETIGSIMAFLIPFVACIFQCYLYLFYSSTRLLKVAVILFFICLCNIYLHGLRNLWQILFHIGVAFLSSYQILTRQLRDKVLHGGV